jgi:hypothetical protein
VERICELGREGRESGVSVLTSGASPSAFLLLITFHQLQHTMAKGGLTGMVLAFVLSMVRNGISKEK